MLLLDAFRVHALHDPGNVLARDPEGVEFTYRQVWNVSELLGAHLIEQTEKGLLQADEPVAILGWDESLLSACVLACAKSKHPHLLVGRDVSPVVDDGRKVMLAASTQLAQAAKEQLKDSAKIFDAELMLSYIVPGMTDDFSCGCGTDDCAHGPFLQECMPSEWFADTGVFAVAADAAHTGMSVAEHDAVLTDALMNEGSANESEERPEILNTPCDRSGDETVRSDAITDIRVPLNLCNPHLAAALATGKEIRLK
jgi:hypothetical protein